MFISPFIDIASEHEDRATCLESMSTTCPVYDSSISTILCNVSESALQCFDNASSASGRTIWDIIWSSLTTIFTCTWVACHPNIPGLDEIRPMERKARRIKVFLVALLAPEVIVLWAMRQFFAAWEMRDRIRQFFEDEDTEEEESTGAAFHLLFIRAISIFFTQTRFKKDNDTRIFYTHGGLRLDRQERRFASCVDAKAL